MPGPLACSLNHASPHIGTRHANASAVAQDQREIRDTRRPSCRRADHTTQAAVARDVETTQPAGAGFQSRRPLPNLGALAGASMNTSIKQEDASTSYYVREPSNHNGTTSPAPYQSSLLRGDQRAFNDPRDVSHSHSASLSIFSSGSSDLTDYQQEEREAARMQTHGSRIQPPVQVQPIVTRRVSAQRKARTSLDDRPYRPGSDDDDDDDDNIRSPTRRRRKGRNSGSLSAYDQGKIDNLRWRNGTAKGTTKKSRGRNSLNSQSAEHDANSGSEDDQDDDDDDDDAGAASGKETRFDGASDEEIDEPVALVAGKPAEATRPQDVQPNHPRSPSGWRWASSGC